ncbi:MAG: hypothetical protein B6245_19820 [Desulfobacteraceae bacterium 4572_88]|nr:MAG: hypothetical protein B6245_19820 [Desulfobacteraceae bacterium 4572_88]
MIFRSNGIAIILNVFLIKSISYIGIKILRSAQGDKLPYNLPPKGKNVGRVIGGLRQTAEKRKLSKRKRKVTEEVIRYFENHKKWTRYDEYRKRAQVLSKRSGIGVPSPSEISLYKR